MTVYFDPRKAKKPVEEMTEDEKNYEMGKQAMTAIANLTVAPLVLMLVWNACIPGIFCTPNPQLLDCSRVICSIKDII